MRDSRVRTNRMALGTRLSLIANPSKRSFRVARDERRDERRREIRLADNRWDRMSDASADGFSIGGCIARSVASPSINDDDDTRQWQRWWRWRWRWRGRGVDERRRTMNITFGRTRVLPFPPPARHPSRFLFLPRYGRINRRGRHRGRVLWSPIGGQLMLIHYYRARYARTSLLGGN